MLKGIDLIKYEDNINSINVKGYKEEGFKDFIVDVVNPAIVRFKDHIVDYTQSALDSFKSDDDVRKIINAHGRTLREIKYEVVSKFDKLSTHGGLMGVQAFKKIEDEKIQYITLTEKPLKEVTDTMGEFYKILNKHNVENIQNFNKLSRYVEKLLNSEDVRTAIIDSDIKKDFKSIIETNKEFEAFKKKLYTREAGNSVKISKILKNCRDYESVVNEAITLSEKINLGFVDTIKKESDRVVERLDLLTSYIGDGSIALSKETGDRFLKIVEEFSMFVSNMAVFCALVIELFESITVISELFKQNLE